MYFWLIGKLCLINVILIPTVPLYMADENKLNMLQNKPFKTNVIFKKKNVIHLILIL